MYTRATPSFKVEASGWPNNAGTDEEKAAYLQEFFDAEGIHLNAENISKNPGLRAIMKFLLNSGKLISTFFLQISICFLILGWGKLCQRTNRSEVVYTTSARETHKYLENSDVEVLDVTHVTKKVDRLVIRHVPTPQSIVSQNPYTNNVTLAVFVTSQARLRLFELMEEAISKNNKILYCDTGLCWPGNTYNDYCL